MLYRVEFITHVYVEADEIGDAIGVARSVLVERQTEGSLVSWLEWMGTEREDEDGIS